MCSFYGWVIFHSIYVPQLFYSFVCGWTPSLLPCPSYVKQCCSEHWGYMCLFQFWFPQRICMVVGLLGHMVVLFLVFSWISILFSIVAISLYIVGSPFPLVFISSQSFCSFMPSGDLYLSAFLVQKGPLAFCTPRLWKHSIINPNFFNSASVKARVKSICRSFQWSLLMGFFKI